MERTEKNNNIEKVLNFIVEVEKLKDVHRKTKPVGLERYENSAEHSWHVSLLALMLKDYADKEVDIDRVIKMLLIHDIGEIDSGDTIIYHSETAELKEQEAAGLERILDLLPESKKEEYMKLWREFESGETPDSKYAKAMDRIPSLLQNLHGGGHAWKENNISKEMVFSVNSRIGEGSGEVWQVIEAKLNEAIDDGLLE